MKTKKYKEGLRCEYHNYENGECIHCGLPDPNAGTVKLLGRRLMLLEPKDNRVDE